MKEERLLTNREIRLVGGEVLEPRKGEYQLVCGRQMESNLHRGSALPPYAHQPEILPLSVRVGVRC